MFVFFCICRKTMDCFHPVGSKWRTLVSQGFVYRWGYVRWTIRKTESWCEIRGGWQLWPWAPSVDQNKIIDIRRLNELLFWSGLSLADITRSDFDRSQLDASLWRFSGHVQMGGASREYPRHTRGILFPFWPGKALGYTRNTRSWRPRLGRRTSALNFLACFPHGPC